jgi:hypothetical protein
VPLFFSHLALLTTSAGIIDHEEARRKHVAGKILGFGALLFLSPPSFLLPLFSLSTFPFFPSLLSSLLLLTFSLIQSLLNSRTLSFGSGGEEAGSRTGFRPRVVVYNAQQC